VAAQVDASLLKALCSQYGTLTWFQLGPAGGRQAFISYTCHEDAMKAQKGLNGILLANTPISAELVPDTSSVTGGTAENGVISAHCSASTPPQHGGRMSGCSSVASQGGVTNLDNIWSQSTPLPRTTTSGATATDISTYWNSGGNGVWSANQLSGSSSGSNNVWASISSDQQH